MANLNHPHPVSILKEDVISPLGLTVGEVANRLNMSRSSISRVLNGRSGISPDLAIKLEAAGVSTARFWLALQRDYDLYEAQSDANDTALKNVVPLMGDHNIASI